MTERTKTAVEELSAAKDELLAGMPGDGQPQLDCCENYVRRGRSAMAAIERAIDQIQLARCEAVAQIEKLG